MHPVQRTHPFPALSTQLTENVTHLLRLKMLPHTQQDVADHDDDDDGEAHGHDDDDKDEGDEREDHQDSKTKQLL